MDNLERLGYSSWFQQRVDNNISADHEIARVISVHKDSYVITRGSDAVFAELAGKLIYSADSAEDLPTTGDWVYADFYDEDSHAIIHHVISRKSLIKRKSSGKTIDFQSIAANIDVAFIIQSADYNFTIRRLERYLVMINESGIRPVILLSKSDLKSPRDFGKMIKAAVNKKTDKNA